QRVHPYSVYSSCPLHRPPCSTLFPYTTLFRSGCSRRRRPRGIPGYHQVSALAWLLLRDDFNDQPARGGYPKVHHSARTNLEHDTVLHSVRSFRVGFGVVGDAPEQRHELTLDLALGGAREDRVPFGHGLRAVHL